MPRRNISLIVVLTVLCLMCAVKVSRHGRILIYAMDQIGLRYVEEVDQDTLFEGAMAGMLSQLDDYSEYIAPEQSQEFQESLDRQFGGIGIQIVLDRDTERLTVASPLVGTPSTWTPERCCRTFPRTSTPPKHWPSSSTSTEGCEA